MQQLVHTDNYASIVTQKNNTISKIVSKITDADEEQKMEVIISFTGEYISPRLVVPTTLAPVYVTKDNSGEEQIVYNSFAMQPRKLYEVEFNGERWALIRNDNDVEFLRFHSNK
jgi:hypothetical protein